MKILVAALSLIVLTTFGNAVIGQPAPDAKSGLRGMQSPVGFDETVARLEKSITGNKMGLVAQASASAGAAARGVKIRGNAVLMVFRNDFAVQMLAASVPAGIEAPLRIYVIEAAGGKTTISWRAPSAIFSPYGSADLNRMAAELDPILEAIVRDAVRG